MVHDASLADNGSTCAPMGDVARGRRPNGTPRKRITLGRYPSMSLAGARAAAIEAKEGRTAGTVAALAEAWLRHSRGKRSAPEIERRLRKDCLPIIGHIPLRELHRRDVTCIIDRKAGAPIAARRAFEDMRAMVRWAVARGDLDHNPMEGMQGPPISKPRTRVLTDDEIRTLWHALDQLPNGVARVIKLCLITAQRVGEVVGITPDEIDTPKAVWMIPASRSKNGHPHCVPLSPMALALIAEGARTDIPSSPGVSRADVSRTVYEAQGQIGLGQWTAHDLRRSALTKMAELGVAPIVLGHVANHRTTTKAGITLGAYVQHQFEREKRDALELWADRLQHITT
jgi:integrase